MLHCFRKDPRDSYSYTYLSSSWCTHRFPLWRKAVWFQKAVPFRKWTFFSGLRLNCSIWGKRGGILPEKHFATVRNWTESDHGFCCISSSSFHLLSDVCSLPVPHLCPPKSVGFQLHSWPSATILLFSCTLSRTFIYTHIFNSIVNDLRGLNHSQDNGCKKWIDMIFMI